MDGPSYGLSEVMGYGLLKATFGAKSEFGATKKYGLSWASMGYDNDKYGLRQV